MTQLERIETIVKALDSKRAEDIQVIGVSGLTILGDYFVIANGTSTTHTKTLAEEVEYQGRSRHAGKAEEMVPVGLYWIIRTLLCMCSIRKPETSTSWNGFGRMEHAWIFPSG